MLRLLHLLRALGHSCFRRFGYHCATHQIRVLLISCVVITSLFYPALAIYSSSQPLSLSLFDAFAARNPASDVNVYNDLTHLWSGHDHLKLRQDAMSRVKCGAARALRIEQIFVQSPVVGDSGAVNHRLLRFALSLETRLNGALSAGDHPCLKRADGQCFVVSPLLFWNHDEDALLADTSVLDTLNTSKNVTVDGITITPQMVLAGRTSREHRVATSTFDFATFLVLTYFFPESDCVSTSEHASWKQSVSSVVSRDADILFQSQGSTLIALEFHPGRSHGKNSSGLGAFVNLAYLCFFVYVAWSVRRMDAVHSRLGITFTALVEIAVSTITSLSVCALVGFKITMVPWELLPIVIVFVGAENMFNLVDAVGKTSVTLPVKQRIAEGLSRAGTSNTLKVLSYIFMLGLMSSLSLGAVREFCIFAIVVLVAHWFLAHTFFMAVLSIDIQRLELEELLRHDPTVVSNASQTTGGVEHLPGSRWRQLVKSFQALLKGRAATNISLLMLLAITTALYYMTYSSSLAMYDPRLRATTVVPQEKTLMSVESMRYSTAGYIWRKMNPSQHPLLHLRIEMPTVVMSLPDSAHAQQIKNPKSLYLRSYIRTFLWLHKIMILPIAGTTSMLYFLLLYLLKDAELLDAQRNREGPGGLDAEAQVNVFQDPMSFSTLPRAFTSDIEHIAPSKDGKTVASVGLGNELIVWRAHRSSFVPVVVEEGVLEPRSARSAISCIAVDEDGKLFAAGTKAGAIFVWDVGKHPVRFLHTLRSNEEPVGVADLRFLQPSPINRENPLTDSPALIDQACAIIAALENGTVVKWVLNEKPHLTCLKPSHQAPVSRALISTVMSDEGFFVSFVFNDGYIELMEVQRNEVFTRPECLLQVGGMSDTITEAHVCRLRLKGNVKIIMALTTDSRKVLLWDMTSKEQICNIECSENPRRLRVMQGFRDVCRACGQLPLESLLIGFAVEQSVKFYQLVLQDQVRHCSCTISPRQRSSSHNEMTSTSNAQSSRTRSSAASEAVSFPVSGHGIYPRRSEATRRSSEISMVRFPSEDYESIHILGANVLRPHSQHGSNSHWRHHSITHLFDISCEKGDWDVACRKAVGLRRKERSKQKSKVVNGQAISSCGLPLSTLDRWEMWVFELATLRLQTSVLSAIASKDHVDSQPPSIPRMPFTRVSPLSVGSTYALAGFGNTIGMFTFSSA